MVPLLALVTRASLALRLQKGRAKGRKSVRICEHGGRAIFNCVSLTPVKTNSSNDEQSESAFPCRLSRRIRPWLSLPWHLLLSKSCHTSRVCGNRALTTRSDRANEDPCVFLRGFATPSSLENSWDLRRMALTHDNDDDDDNIHVNVNIIVKIILRVKIIVMCIATGTWNIIVTVHVIVQIPTIAKKKRKSKNEEWTLFYTLKISQTKWSTCPTVQM